MGGQDAAGYAERAAKRAFPVRVRAARRRPAEREDCGRALEAEARVYASYGMTETSSQVANTLITPQFTGGMRLLPGYSARIVEPDAEGFGRLALRGPGVFGGYANARAAFTVDGFFLTAIRRRFTTAVFTCASARRHVHLRR